MERQANMPEEKSTILAVDDNPDTLELMQAMLEEEDYHLLTASTGAKAIQTFRENRVSLVLLDIMLPDIDGYAVCKRIRKISTVPVIMVTAKDREEEEAIGLEAGADDYITRPFTSVILLSHIKAALRRSLILESRVSPSPFQSHGLNIDFFRQTVTIDGKIVKLTATESRILALLSRHSGIIVSPEEIIRNVWGVEYEDDSSILQVNISRLRNKLEEYSRGIQYIRTKHGQGYLLQ